MNAYQLFGKRLIDLVTSGIFLLLFTWLFLLITAVYIFTLQFPVFFKQQRIGRDGRLFYLLKFRTLSTNDSLTLQQRRFTWGDFLRRYSLDELPQLIHVLKGEMSLVGPRPLPVAYQRLFSEEQRARHKTRPGITGLAQVNGRNSISWKEKFEYDIQYVNHISFVMDMKILWKTLVLLFSFRHDVSLNEEPFKGNN